MFLDVKPSSLQGSVPMPGSKSHTVRALLLAALAEGESRIYQPLDSLDTRAAVNACRAFGAQVNLDRSQCWTVQGVGGVPQTPENVLDVGNSGTTLYIVMATAALNPHGWTILTGDEQIRRRPADKLIGALKDLGAEIISTRNNARCPLAIRGPWKGGTTKIEAVTSQWVTALLLNAPLAEGDTEITVPLLNEAPYVQMTLDWMRFLRLKWEGAEDFSRFRVPAGQKWKGFERAVPADFSSATFFLVAGAALDANLELTGLDLEDCQGDKAVVDYLREMGAILEVNDEHLYICIKKSPLKGVELDLNATPDALPALAVAGALADGETRLVNVPQARFKETDRISVMAQELTKMGVRCRELRDGLIIRGTGGKLKAARNLKGHGDHRVVMALSLAAMAADGPCRIDTAEAVAVTFPDYGKLMEKLGANFAWVPEEAKRKDGPS